MNMFRAFMELDEINEELSRQEIISRLRALGKNYNFNKYPDKQLYGMLMSALEKKEKEKAAKLNATKTCNNSTPCFEPNSMSRCDFCGTRFTDFGQCPICDLGEEDYS